MTVPLHVVRPATRKDAGAVALLHTAEIPTGFLTTLGPRFLRRLYARAVVAPRSFVLVGGRDDIDGFVAAVESTSAFYRDFMVHDALVAGVATAPALLRAPGRVWETFRYGSTHEATLPAAEILSIAVAPEARGHGLGRALLDAALHELRSRGVNSARVVTAVDNGPALRMYEAAGFHRRTRTEVHAGVTQDVLVWP